MPYGRFFWGVRTSPEIRRLVTDETLAVLPVGSVEQHGDHLALYTDNVVPTVVLEKTCARLDPSYPLLVLPPLAYGHSIEHGRAPGTVSLSAATLSAVMKDIGESVAAAGITRFVIANGHGGNVGILQTVAREIRIATGMLVFLLNMGGLGPRGVFGEDEARWGIHAGAYETSVVWGGAPEYVRPELRGSERPVFDPPLEHLTVNGPLRFAWTAADLSASGQMGDASQASAEAGRAILEAMVEKMRQVLEEIRTFRFPHAPPSV